LFLQIKQLKLVIEDDPFEVKLGYNYALMCDEYLESVKRRQTLEQRRTIKENNLELKALEILKERESSINIKRSRLIYYTKFNNKLHPAPIRAELFCFLADNLELYALADLEWHGRQNCYDILRKIDSCSPEPPAPSKHSTSGGQPAKPSFNPAGSYSILWCRHANLKLNEFKFSFRDYTQPLIRIANLNLFGKLLGSEMQPSFRSIRQVRIGAASDLLHMDNATYIVERNMSPFKFYHDLCAKMNVFTFAYGPCWEVN
jgi:hypothetical protein